jgi:hypothetical protein
MAQRDAYKYEAHEFKRRAAGKLYCTYCGLFSLNNPFTEWSIRMGCNHRDHPQYESKRYELTKLNY